MRAPGPVLSLLAIIALAATACRGRQARPAADAVTHVHPNGLVLALPRAIGGRTFTVDRTPAGFVVGDERPQVRRYAAQVTVDLRPGIATPPGAFPETRRIGGRPIRYAITELEGSVGSGGQEYMLRAWEPARGGHVAYQQQVQTEGDPDFSLADAVIAGTTPPP